MPFLVLRPALPADAPFLFALYASTRKAELDALPEPQRMTLLEMQYRAREAGHRGSHPRGVEQVVESDGVLVGRWFVDRSGAAIVLVDVAIVPERRGQGLGSALLTELCKEADRDRRAIELQVADENPAERLYLRFGFTLRAHAPPYRTMRRDPRAADG